VGEVHFDWPETEAEKSVPSRCDPYPWQQGGGSVGSKGKKMVTALDAKLVKTEGKGQGTKAL